MFEYILLLIVNKGPSIASCPILQECKTSNSCKLKLVIGSKSQVVAELQNLWVINLNRDNLRFALYNSARESATLSIFKYSYNVCLTQFSRELVHPYVSSLRWSGQNLMYWNANGNYVVKNQSVMKAKNMSKPTFSSSVPAAINGWAKKKVWQENKFDSWPYFLMAHTSFYESPMQRFVIDTNAPIDGYVDYDETKAVVTTRKSLHIGLIKGSNVVNEKSILCKDGFTFSRCQIVGPYIFVLANVEHTSKIMKYDFQLKLIEEQAVDGLQDFWVLGN